MGIGKVLPTIVFIIISVMLILAPLPAMAPGSPLLHSQNCPNGTGNCVVYIDLSRDGVCDIGVERTLILPQHAALRFNACSNSEA